MAKKTDIAAAKARKQKIILAVAGVAMLGVAAIQVPKLMKSDSQATAAPAATAAATTAAPTATVTAAAVVGGANPGTFEPAAYVAGVALPSGATVVVAKSRLASFTLFEAKDPFVQQASDATAAGQAGAAPTPSVDPAPTASGSEPAAAADGGTSTAPPPPVVYATILLDGKSQPLKVKQKFPTGDPLFVLVGLAKNRAKIGVAGGSFDDGQNVTLTLGKKVTLVDTATGVRYELKLVYTGSAPEQVEGFSASAATPAP